MKDFIVNFIKNFLSNLLNTRFYWLCVILISFTFECCGMYFQYIEKLDPCEKCVYERMAYMGILISGIIGIILPKILKYPALLLTGIFGIQRADDFHRAPCRCAEYLQHLQQHDTGAFLDPA